MDDPFLFCCDEQLRQILRSLPKDEHPLQQPVLLWHLLLEARPDLIARDFTLPGEEVFAFAQRLRAQHLTLPDFRLPLDPDERAYTPEDLISELCRTLAIALLYWSFGKLPPRLPRTRESWTLQNDFLWSPPLSDAPQQLLSGLTEPRFLADFQFERRQAAQSLSGKGESVIAWMVELCLRENLIPGPTLLSWSVLTCPQLELPFLWENLREALRQDVFGTLPEKEVVADDNRLMVDGETWLDRNSRYDTAEHILGRGRVGRWIRRPDGWLRVTFNQSFLTGIEFRKA